MRSRKSTMVRAALLGALLGGGVALSSVPAPAAAEEQACPCWTGAVLQRMVGEGHPVWCKKGSYWDGSSFTTVDIFGARNGRVEAAGMRGRNGCHYSGVDGLYPRADRTDLSPAVRKACYDSIVAECGRRGLIIQR